jgi:hypothetical protein
MAQDPAAERQERTLVKRHELVQGGRFARLPGPQQRGLSVGMLLTLTHRAQPGLDAHALLPPLIDPHPIKRGRWKNQ